MKYIKSEVQNIISIMNKITGLEYAVFNVDSQLIASTKTYLEVKGEKVHSNSIKDVLRQGNVVVNHPGHMQSCFGCRFVNNCPSTIEILSAIKINNEPIGIVSLTSFSTEGHNMIEEDINTYISLLANISDLLIASSTSEMFKRDIDTIHRIIQELIKQTEENYIVIDNKGIILYLDVETQKEFLSYCDLYTNSIEQIFPSNIVKLIFSTNTYTKEYFTTKDKNFNLHINPINTDTGILGYIIKLEKEKSMITHTNNHLDMIISKDRQIKSIKEKVKKIASSPSPVVITGDTGTGKELFAKAIHYIGDKSDKPFIAINCSSIPESLFESELFGYEEGAFTGAKKGGKMGLFEMADGGSLFLDEIGELPLHLQAKLLRVLQENRIQRVGGISTIPINVRLIAATNKDLEEMILKETFRNDLFFRINVIPIYIPTLIERPEDIELLANFFIKKYSSKLNKNIAGISEDSLTILKSYSWPGNIRELENAIEFGVNMEDTSVLTEKNLPERIKGEIYNSNKSIKTQLLENQIDIIVRTLNKNGWDLKGKEETAKDLGISLRTLYRKIEDKEKYS